METRQQETATHRRLQLWWGYRKPTMAIVSIVVCSLLWVCYRQQPDILAALTLIPPWCWLLLGLAGTAKSMERRRRWPWIASFVLWIAFAFFRVEELRAVFRPRGAETFPAKVSLDGRRDLRVATLNCCIGQPNDVRRLTPLEPDIIFLQESPGVDKLTELTNELFGGDGSFVSSGDTSILSRGQIEPRFVDPASHFTHAEVQLPGRTALHVICVRLRPPVTRLDFWSSSFWVDHRANRLHHRVQIDAVVKQIRGLASTERVIVAGDFNAPPIDAATRPLREFLYDVFEDAGVGIGNTGTNRFPLFRVDQIWASRNLKAIVAATVRSQNSDHRAVVCDLRIP